MTFNFKRKATLCLSVLALSLMVSCSGDDDTPEEIKTEGDETEAAYDGFLDSNLDALGTIDLDGFKIPDTYDIEGVFAPGAYSGQIRRLAQLTQIKNELREQPITWDIVTAFGDATYMNFTDLASNETVTNSLEYKTDELSYDEGFTSVADDFKKLGELLVTASSNTEVAANGTAGYLDGRHFSDNGLEYAQIFEKGLYGAVFYDQMADDYLRDSQAGPDNANGNNQAVGYSASNGTDRQHRWDEAFGYFGADPATYPNTANTSNGDGEFIANYTFDRSDETEAAFGVNLAEKAMEAFITGRAALKAGEGLTADAETEYEDVFNAARADAKLYVEAGIAATAFHYLNSTIEDVEQVNLNVAGAEADKLHHLSEALAFIYCLSFNSEGKISITEVQAVFDKLGWKTTLDASSGMISMEELYDLNLWDVTVEELEAARSLLNDSFPGFINAGF